MLYDPADGSKKLQNVHSKRWTDPEDYDKLKTQKGLRTHLQERKARAMDNVLGAAEKVPDDVLNIYPDGSFYIGMGGEGQFATFTPNQRRRLKRSKRLTESSYLVYSRGFLTGNFAQRTIEIT